MKIATWNVNGIRARQAQLEEWMANERPDVICLQEIKASPEQIPTMLFEMEGYWCYWHGAKGYSGVGLHVKKELAPARPEFSHPPFDHESRIVVAKIGELSVASVYVPNGGKDFVAKMKFLGGARLPTPRRSSRPARRWSCAATSTWPAPTSTCTPRSARRTPSASCPKSGC